jgi:hypothetical protein
MVEILRFIVSLERREIERESARTSKIAGMWRRKDAEKEALFVSFGPNTEGARFIDAIYTS